MRRNDASSNESWNPNRGGASTEGVLPAVWRPRDAGADRGEARGTEAERSSASQMTLSRYPSLAKSVSQLTGHDMEELWRIATNANTPDVEEYQRDVAKAKLKAAAILNEAPDAYGLQVPPPPPLATRINRAAQESDPLLNPARSLRPRRPPSAAREPLRRT